MRQPRDSPKEQSVKPDNKPRNGQKIKTGLKIESLTRNRG